MLVREDKEERRWGKENGQGTIYKVTRYTFNVNQSLT